MTIGPIRRPSPAGTSRSRAARRPRPPRGFSLLEVQVAFAVLAIGLAGLCPLVVMQLRQVRVLENRMQGQVVQYRASTGTRTTMLPGNTYYIVPWQNPLAQKLAGSAQIVLSSPIPCDPGTLPLSTPAPTSYPVSIAELDAPPYSLTITAYVDVSAP